jgi:hypothetical protein
MTRILLLLMTIHLAGCTPDPSGKESSTITLSLTILLILLVAVIVRIIRRRSKQEAPKAKSNPYPVIIVMATLIGGYYFIIRPANEEGQSSPQLEFENVSTQKELNKQKKDSKCSKCNGTGTVVCTMCNGTGINNMGVDCGCLRYNHVMEQMGKPTDPYQGSIHKCIRCKGTGYVANKY